MYDQSYVANTSSVDGRSAFFNEPVQYDHVDYFQSFAKYREKSLSSSLPAEMEAVIRRDPQLLDLEDQIQRLRTGNGTASETKATQNKARNYHASLVKKRLQQYQLEWVRDRRDWKVMIYGKERSEDKAQTDLVEILSQLMPECGCLAKTMISDTVVSEEERHQAIEDLCSLVFQNTSISYRPGEKPINGYGVEIRK